MSTLLENKLGIILKELRSQKGYSLRKLSELTGISFSYIGKFEQGRIPSKEDLIKIADALEVADKNNLLILAGYVPDEVAVSIEIPKINLDYNLTEIFNNKIKELSGFKFRGSFTTNYDNYLRNVFTFYLNVFSNESLTLETTKHIKELGLTEDISLKLQEILIKRNYESIDESEKLKLFELFNSIVMESEEHSYSFSKSESSYSVDSMFVDKSENMTIAETKSYYKNRLLEKSKNKLEEIMGRINNNNPISMPETIEPEFIKIPIYGEIKAGYDMFAQENITDHQIVSRKDVSDGEYFYLIVRGDSMIDDGIIQGCKVLVKKQNSVPDGKIAVVLINGEEATLKRVYYQGDKVFLVAANKTIPPRTYDISEIQIQGLVKSYVVDL